MDSRISILWPLLEMLAPLIPMAIILYKKPKKSRWIVTLIIALVIYMLLVAYGNFFESTQNNNILVYIGITLVTFIGFSIVICYLIKNVRFAFFNKIVICMVVLFTIFNALYGEKLIVFNSITATLVNLILIIYCLIYYGKQLANPEVVLIHKQPAFWVISGIFIYSAGCFVLFSFYHQLSNQYWQFALYSWIGVDILIVIMNAFFAKAILCSSQ